MGELVVKRTDGRSLVTARVSLNVTQGEEWADTSASGAWLIATQQFAAGVFGTSRSWL